MENDHVDMILEQWKRERPDLNAFPMGIIGRISRLDYYFSHHLQTVFDKYDLQSGEFDLLAALRRSGNTYAVNPSDLYKTLMITSGGLTNRIDRLERAGLITRVPDPKDRRGTLIQLTDKGLLLIDEAIQGHVENETELLAALSPSEQKALSDLLRKLLGTTE